MSAVKNSSIILGAAAVAFIIFAIVITAVVQGPADKAFSQVVTVGPVWNGDVWSCTSNSDFMIHAVLRSTGESQLAINIPDLGTQSLYTLEPGQMETFSVGAKADSTIIITRTGTVTGFITLQTASDTNAGCVQP